MKNKWSLLFVAALLVAFIAGCSTYSGSDKAIVGGGAIAGKDYVCGLEPSDGARDYFNSISDDAPIETVRRTSENESKSGVKFVNNGGILIPPGVTISFDNQGYCMDPHLPASKDGEEFQLIPMSRLIPSELQGTYKNLIAQESAGNSAVRSNMQHLVWALRTAGTDAAYANNLTPQQKSILDQYSEYQGQFELFHEREKAGNKVINDLLGMADSVLNVSIGGVTYKASDLLDPDIANKKIEEHLNQLIDLSEYLPVENIGLNYGEIEPGIYTDVHGTGYLSYHARIANSTSRPFIFYPSDYVGQVGSPAKKSGLFAAADSSMRQRVTGMNQNKVTVVGISGNASDKKYSKTAGNYSGNNPFSSPKDLLKMVKNTSTTDETCGAIFKNGKKLFISNLQTVGETGGTRQELPKEAVAGFHSHPERGNFSPADIVSVLTAQKPELVADLSTNTVHMLTVNEAQKAWQQISIIYKNETGKNIPDHQTVARNQNNECNEIDKVIDNYISKKLAELEREKNAKENEVYSKQYDSEREGKKAKSDWEKIGKKEFKKKEEEIRNTGSVPLTKDNKWTTGKGL